ncbi:MAG: acyltransferase [Pseudomonadota bacterium]
MNAPAPAPPTTAHPAGMMSSMASLPLAAAEGRPVTLPKRSSGRVAAKIARVAREESAGLHLRLLLARALLWPLPLMVGGRLRGIVLRALGFRIGHGTIFAGMPVLLGGRGLHRNLEIRDICWINIGCVFDLNAPIFIGSRVALGHEVLLLTSTHEIGPPTQRAAPTVTARPIVINDGAWLGARCTILPGVSIGAGAVVAAGALVTRDVPPNSMVAGTPARLVRML